MTAFSEQLFDRLAAALGDRYIVEREIGSGGMAIVFAARDVRHNRTVAVKVLRPELALSLGAARFLREIELAAGLQHPHIVPVYDSGASDGVFYYVMPFIDGEALSARIVREGALPVAAAVRIAREVARALAYAHEHGIVHRDIKPENIMLATGHALVTDFGIARAVDAASGRLTATGMAVGTPMYMSPEQALGSGEVDARSDIYSLGCVLYEMLTGQQPFAGASLQAILAQSITAPRPRASKMRRDISGALDDVVVKALSTEPTDRYQTAAKLDDALAATGSTDRFQRSSRWRRPAIAAAAVVLAAVAATWGLRSHRVGAAESVAADARVIAVLPFAASGADTAGLSEGLVDLISTNLDGVGGIRMIAPRTALGRWRARAGTAGTLDRAGTLALGRDLDAGAVLTGSVVTLGSSVRVSAELVGVNGTPLAKAQADGPTDAMLTIVDTLSVRLLRDVWRSTSPVPGLRVSALTTGSLPAMRAYLEGEQHFRRSDWAAAERAYSRAIEQDSSFALAYLRLLTTDEWLGVSTVNIRVLGAMLRRRVDRLSSRERGLAIGALLYHDGQLAALDTALALTARYPDALDAWMLLGETRFHAQPLLAPSSGEMRMPFERVLAIDSSLTSVYVHLLDVSVLFADSSRFARDLARMRAVAGAEDTTVTLYQLVGNAMWAPATASSQAIRTIIEQRPSILYLLVRGTLAVPAAALRLMAEFDRAGTALPGELSQLERTNFFLAIGRVTDARAAWRALVASHPDLQQAYPLGSDPLFMGMADSTETLDALRLTMKKWMPRSFGLLAAAEYGIATHDTLLVRRSVDEVLAIDTTRLPTRFHPPAEVMHGWSRIAMGDSAAGARAIGDVIARSDFTLTHLIRTARWVRAVTLSRDPSTRAEGIRLLRYGFLTEPQFFGVRQLALREALLAAGDKPAADSAVAVAAPVWTHADPAARAAVRRAYPRAFAP